MLAVDCVIYLLLAFYIEAVFPGEFGLPQPWNFPFKVWKLMIRPHGHIPFKSAPFNRLFMLMEFMNLIANRDSLHSFEI